MTPFDRSLVGVAIFGIVTGLGTMALALWAGVLGLALCGAVTAFAALVIHREARS